MGRGSTCATHARSHLGEVRSYRPMMALKINIGIGTTIKKIKLFYTKETVVLTNVKNTLCDFNNKFQSCSVFLTRMLTLLDIFDNFIWKNLK